MRLLIIAYFYHPALTPRAFRWTAIAEQLASRGFTVDVVCAAQQDLPAVQTVNGVHVHRVGGNARGNLRRWLGEEPIGAAPHKSGVSSSTSTSTSTSTVRGRIVVVLKEIYRQTLQKVMWPDFTGLWYFPALKLARILMGQKRYDVVVSVSVPFTGHLVGLALRKYYPAARWVVDVGDPFSFMNETPVNNHRLFSRLNYYAEQKVLEGADVVSVTTDETRTEYLRYFNEMDADKITVIAPLFVPPTETGDDLPYFTVPNKTRMVFAGTLYKSIRNPAALLELFNSLIGITVDRHIELHFFGAMNDCEWYFDKYKKMIGVNIFLHGLVPRETALRAMKEATVLVNIGNSTSYQLPSKVVEYVMLGKPVLNITKLSTDSSQNFFSGFTGICTVTEQGLIGNSAEVRRVRDFIQDPPLISDSEVEKLSRIHSIDAIVNSYIDLFQNKKN
ncbi:MAG: glycosyltransferase [Glaciimonas sp.]|nr:glycosyltransferase [Glaciimonas sp.]